MDKEEAGDAPVSAFFTRNAMPTFSITAQQSLHGERTRHRDGIVPATSANA